MTGRILTADVERHFMTYPYLLCDSKDGRCIVVNPQRSTEIQTETELLFLLEQLAVPTPVSTISRQFGVDESSIQKLVELGIIVDPASMDNGGQRDRNSKVGIVTTMRAPGRQLDSWLRYHQSIGVDHVFLFFDDPEDEAIQRARRYTNVSVTPCDGALRDKQKHGMLFKDMERHLHTELMSKLVLNAESAIGMAERAGVDWLVHIDQDELFFTRHDLGSYFDNIPPEVGIVTFFNYEAAPEKLHYQDPFEEVTLFKRNPVVLGSAQTQLLGSRGKPNFLVYSNGKSAVRVAPGALPDGVHLFKPSPRHTGWLRPPLEPAVLHYVYCDFDAYLKKYSNWGNFGDRQWGTSGTVWHEFHRLSRDACQSGDLGAVRSLYENKVVYRDPDETNEYIRQGLCVRIDGPRQLLTSTNQGR